MDVRSSLTVTEDQPILDMPDLDAEMPIHLSCCVEDAFLCGADYHPEADAYKGAAPEETCRPCGNILHGMICASGSVGHWHCPVKQGRICPFTTDGRRITGTEEPRRPSES